MDPKKLGGKVSYAAATSSSSSPKNWVGHSSESFGFGNIPKFDQLIPDVAGLSIDTPQDNAVFSKNNKNQGETSSPKQWGTRINEELRETVCDREIVWPPMVIVRYHDKLKDVRWLHMRKRKLSDYDRRLARFSVGPDGLLHHFSGYNPVGSRDSFSLLGISLLIFESSAIGYVDAERLHNHFADQGTDKDAWDRCKFLDGTPDQFYGYMANKEDMDFFNQLRGELKVEFEMRSHHEMVVIPMDGVNQRLFWLYSKLVKEEKDAKARQVIYGKRAERLREIIEEDRIVRQRTKLLHEQNKAEMDYQEQFFKDQSNHIHQASEEERAFEKLLPGALCETVCDREIVWPPMVMVRYHEKDDNEEVYKDANAKWIRRENRKLPDYNAVLPRDSAGPHGLLHIFSGFNAVEARHSFGDRGTSLLIFENSAVGYVEAERLHKHFVDKGSDKDAWDHCKLLDGTHHQFYGYMANKEDVDIFNHQCRGEMKVEFEMRSHHEMVVIPMDGVVNRDLFLLYSNSVKRVKDAKACQDYYGKAAEKLRETIEEDRIVRQRTKLLHEQNKAEMDYQEQFFKDQINHIERAFEELLPEERKKMQQSIVDTSANEDLRQEEISKVIQTQAKRVSAKNMKEIWAERENPIQTQANKRVSAKNMKERVKNMKEIFAERENLFQTQAKKAKRVSAKNMKEILAERENLIQFLEGDNINPYW